MAGGAGHLFWRDPAVGVFGLYRSYVYGTGNWGIDAGGFTNSGMFDAKGGLEGQLYFGRLTLQGIAGVEWNNFSKSTGYFYNGDSEAQFFDDIRLHWEGNKPPSALRLSAEKLDCHRHARNAETNSSAYPEPTSTSQQPLRATNVP